MLLKRCANAVLNVRWALLLVEWLLIPCGRGQSSTTWIHPLYHSCIPYTQISNSRVHEWPPKLYLPTPVGCLLDLCCSGHFIVVLQVETT